MLSSTDKPILSTTILSQSHQLLLTKHKSPGSGRFYFGCWFLLKITQVLDEILFMTTLAGPAHLLQFVTSVVSTEGEPTQHVPGRALVLARRLLAVPWLWQGPPWMGQGPVAHSCTPLWWQCQKTQLRGGEVSAEQDRGHWDALSMLAGCPVKASLWSWRPIGKGLERSVFFSIRNYLSTRPWAKPAVAPSCQWELCTSALKAAQTCCTYSVTAARSHCLLGRLLCVPSPTCHDRNKPVRSSLCTTFFFLFKWCDLLLENPDSIPLNQLLFCENRKQGIYQGLACMFQEIIGKHSWKSALQHLEVLVLSSGGFRSHLHREKTKSWRL